MKISLSTTFTLDTQGRRYSDVMNNPKAPTGIMLEFFDDPDRQRRMIEAELHHDRPALAGVLKEFEELPAISKFFTTHKPQQTLRFRQAVGVAVRIVMVERLGWKTTGLKGSVAAKWFSRPERYAKA